MRPLLLIGSVLALALTGCGLENVFTNATHKAYDRPASKIRGSAPFAGATISRITVLDANGKVLTPFQSTMDAAGNYELRLPSSNYTMLTVRFRYANADLRVIVPSIGPESVASGVDFNALLVTESLIVETRLAADGKSLAPVSPSAYLGLRDLVKQNSAVPGPTKDLYDMVGRVLALYDRYSIVDPANFFRVPEASRTGGAAGPINVTASPLDNDWLVRLSPLLDYDGDGVGETNSAKFDAKLATVAADPLYDPAGCPDPNRLRLVFTVDFRAGKLNGNCATVDRFKWATDKPGKQMFFVGWIHEQSAIQDPATNAALGSSTPNTIPMYDDGTNGDEVAGDGIWTATFDVLARDPADPTNAKKTLRIGYKYTWGFQGAVWTGSEEWPGNSRILEVVDETGDGIVYRRDVFGDEATNKDKSNLNLKSSGVIDWTTDLHCGGGHPEARESFYDNASCTCGPAYPPPPAAVGPINVACTAP